MARRDDPRQGDLFERRRRRNGLADARKLMRALRRAAGGPEPVRFGGRAGIKRLMTPLPPITVPWDDE